MLSYLFLPFFFFQFLFYGLQKVRTSARSILSRCYLKCFSLIYAFVLFCFIFSIYIIYIFYIKVKQSTFIVISPLWCYLFTGDKLGVTCSLFPPRWPFSALCRKTSKLPSLNSVQQQRKCNLVVFSDIIWQLGATL